MTDYRAVLAVQPQDPAGWNNLGNASAGLGRWKDAAEFYGKAASLAPEFAFSKANRAVAMFQLGDTNESMREMRYRPEQHCTLQQFFSWHQLAAASPYVCCLLQLYRQNTLVASEVCRWSAHKTCQECISITKFDEILSFACDAIITRLRHAMHNNVRLCTAELWCGAILTFQICEQL